MVKPTRTARPATLRAEQTRLTRERIVDALTDLLDEVGGADSITFKAVAARAGVTEMTVYRHFPTRDALLHGLWEGLNRAMGPDLRLPETVAGLREQHLALFRGFDRIPAQILASLTTTQGREMRASLDRRRRKAFLAIVDEHAPGLTGERRRGAAGVLQLLHSAYAWLSLREHWGLSGAAAGRATLRAIDCILRDLKESS